jgi:hypothetical protein
MVADVQCRQRCRIESATQEVKRRKVLKVQSNAQNRANREEGRMKDWKV